MWTLAVPILVAKAGPAVHARECLGRDCLLRSKGGSRRSNPAERGFVKDCFCFRNIHQRKSRQEVGGSPTALSAGEGPCTPCILGKRAIELPHDIAGNRAHVVVTDIGIIVIDLLVPDVGFYVVTMFSHETLTEPRSPHPICLDFPRIDEKSGLGTLIGLGKPLVHPVGIAEEGILVQMVENARHLGMVPGIWTYCHFHGVEIGPGLVAVRKVHVIERPERTIGKITPQSEGICYMFCIDHRFTPLWGKEIRMRGVLRKEHRVNPRNLNTSERMVFQPDKLVTYIFLVYVRRKPPPARVWFMAGKQAFHRLFFFTAAIECEKAGNKQHGKKQKFTHVIGYKESIYSAGLQ